MNLFIINYGSDLSGGSLKYLKKMVPRISKNNKISNLTTYVPKTTINYFSNESNIKPIVSRKDLIGVVSKQQPDLIFFPSIQYIKKWDVPFVVMVRNMEPFTKYELVNPMITKLKNYGRKVLTIKACKVSSGVISVSEYVTNVLSQYKSIENNKIKTIYHGINKKHKNLLGLEQKNFFLLLGL